MVELMATKIGRGDYVLDIYVYAKLHYEPIRGFCPCIYKVAYQMFTRLVFLGSFNLTSGCLNTVDVFCLRNKM